LHRTSSISFIATVYSIKTFRVVYPTQPTAQYLMPVYQLLKSAKLGLLLLLCEYKQKRLRDINFTFNLELYHNRRESLFQSFNCKNEFKLWCKTNHTIL